MAGRFRKIACLVALVQFACLGAQSFGQDAAPSPASSPDDAKGKRDKPLRKNFENLTPEQQQKIRENAERWQQMTPEEKKAMREREQARRQKILKEVDDALKQSGLTLDDETRETFVQRYTQERRKIEEKLQKELEEKRKPLVQDLINKLKTEFQDKSEPSPSSSPAATSAPK